MQFIRTRTSEYRGSVSIPLPWAIRRFIKKIEHQLLTIIFPFILLASIVQSIIVIVPCTYDLR